LVNRGRSTGQLGIDIDTFPTTPNNWTWSSSPDVTCPTCAWDISFNEPNLFENIDHKNSAYSIRLVRGTPKAYTSSTRFNTVADSGGSEILDSLTGLIWQRCTVGMNWNGTTCTGAANSYSWRGALSYTQALSDSYSNEKKWRLPNIAELYSIADHSKDSPAINTQWFPQTPAAWTWSSSPNVQTANEAWFIDFSVGISGSDSIESAFPIRMVRGRSP
jgi:Protein of unknown function (DUF1566)